MCRSGRVAGHQEEEQAPPRAPALEWLPRLGQLVSAPTASRTQPDLEACVLQ